MVSLGCGWSRQHTDMKGSCKYIRLAVADSWQRMVLQLGGWAKGWQLLTIRYQPVMKCCTGSQTWTRYCSVRTVNIFSTRFLNLDCLFAFSMNVTIPGFAEWHNKKVADKSFENVAEFKCLGMTITNQNYILNEIKSRLSSKDDCYHSVQNLVFPALIYKPKH